MAVVYNHKRNDTGEVFYVGIGNEKRAYSKRMRNKWWHHIVNKHGYSVEITHSDIIWEEACAIERYLIAFYGRADKGLGPLVNLTDGGEGLSNPSIETVNKMKSSHTGKKLCEKTIKKLKDFQKQNTAAFATRFKKGHNSWNKNKKHSENHKINLSLNSSIAKEVIDIKTGQKFRSATEAAKFLNIQGYTLRRMLTGITKNKTSLKYVS